MTADTDVSRRAFLRSAAGGSVIAGATATAAAQEGGSAGEPEYDGWFDDVANFDGTAQRRGESEVTVAVGAEGNGGNFAFDPPAIWVDTGTTVIWEWTGQGNAHNVVASDESFDSGSAVAQAGTTFQHTFEESGIYPYVCEPHETLGMKGAVVVGDDVPTTGGGGEGGASVPTLPDSAKTLGVATGFAMLSTLGFAYFFIKYGGDYGEPTEPR